MKIIPQQKWLNIPVGDFPEIYFDSVAISTWWLIPLSKWFITPVISGLTLLIPFITWVITHLLSGMSHQVDISSSTQTWLAGNSSVDRLSHKPPWLGHHVSATFEAGCRWSSRISQEYKVSPPALGFMLVGGWAYRLPLWKIMEWVRQLGWWHSQLFLEKFQTCSKPPTSLYM